MNIKITSDGTSRGTRIVNVDTGERVGGVTGITYTVGVDGVSRAVLEFVNVPLEYVGPADQVRHIENITLGGGQQ